MCWCNDMNMLVLVVFIIALTMDVFFMYLGRGKGDAGISRSVHKGKKTRDD